MDNLFSTHPNTENRIAELEELAREMGQTAGRATTIAAAPTMPVRGRSSPPRARGGSSGPWG